MNDEAFWEEADYDAQDRAMEAQERTARVYDQEQESIADPRIAHFEAGAAKVPTESIADLLNLSIWETQLGRANYYDWFLEEVTR